MKKIGIICEFNPFHNGHLHFIREIKNKYPDSILILIISGYFTQRGDVSLISKYNKTDIALDYGIDIVIELPTVYTLNSADLFAENAVKILNYMNLDILAFGSETTNLNLLTNCAKRQIEDNNFNIEVKQNLKKGDNYSSAIFESLEVKLNSNDILGVSYIKSIIKNNFDIEIMLIKRTNNFNDLKSNEKIISATNIRNKFYNNIKIDKYIPIYNKNYIKLINKNKLFQLLKYKILTDNDLSEYQGVNEGLNFRLVKYILECNNIYDLIIKLKSKRHSISRIKRMLICILLGITKKDNFIETNYVRILGFNNQGRQYLSKINTNIIFSSNKNMRIQEIENRAETLYNYLTDDTMSTRYEKKNKPIKKTSY